LASEDSVQQFEFHQFILFMLGINYRAQEVKYLMLDELSALNETMRNKLFTRALLFMLNVTSLDMLLITGYNEGVNPKFPSWRL
jgi:hypothetical protein